MADERIPQYAALLKKQYIFQGLSDIELARVVSRFEATAFKLGEVIFQQGSAGESFYVIFQGQVRVSFRDQGGDEKAIDILKAGEHLGEDALLFDRPRMVTATASEPTILLRLDREPFLQILKDLPHLRLNLAATAESRYLAQIKHFDWVGDDEIVHLIVHRHEWFLFANLVIPIVLILIAIPILIFGVVFAPTQFFKLFASAAGALGIVAAIVIGLWNLLDWSNDYYIVTSQRVVWLEKMIFLYESRREAPLTQVKSVNVRTSWLGRIIGFGDVIVSTFTGEIRLRRAQHPERFASFVEGFRVRASEETHLVEKAAMEKELERTLRERLGGGIESPASPSGAPAAAQAAPKVRNPAKPGSLREKWETFFQVRYERNGVITYRKHILVLIGKLFWPSLLIFLSIIAGGLLLYEYFTGVLNLLIEVSLMSVLMVFFVFFLGWWIYNYLDWSNDIYQITPTQILDIERRPLGEEQRKSASIENIFSLEYSRDGIIQILFNFGDVIINIGQTPFVFRVVADPAQVHHDISHYIEEFNRRKKSVETAREREHMVDWLTAYSKHSDRVGKSKRDTDWEIFPR
jgi:hypothetical protein